MALKFSADGQYFAQISTDGKLRVWNTLSNTFEQEFTPDFHLTSPCTCLHFLPTQAHNNGATPRKKKRKESSSAIVLGTSSGLLLVYSISKADLDFTINSETSEAITCLSSTDHETIYSGAEQNVIVWDLAKKKIQSKWKSGNDKITAVLALPQSNRLITASKSIKLWDIENKEVLKSYTGHSSDIILLQHVKPNRNNDEYFISGSKGDRLLCCWSLKENAKERNAAASFSMEDVIQSISIEFDEDGSTWLAANVRSGVVHVYQHTLNGKCAKPLKPKTTIQVIADTDKSSDLVSPIRIFGVIHRDAKTLCIGYGNEILLSFENVRISTYKKLDCLIRKDPKQLAITKSDQTTKIKTPIVNDDVHYLTPHISTVSGAKRKQDGQIEIPMEQRLENLALNKLDDSKVPRSDNVAQLLLQGLHSKDKNILRTVLSKRDENVIRNTVKRLSVAAIVPLVQELNNYIQGKTLSTQIGATWLRQILQTHASILLSNPELPELLTPALSSIQSRLTLQTPLNRLKGRLDLLVSQVSTTASSNENEEPLLMFNDKDSSDSDEEEIELMDAHSESDNEWIEESDDMAEDGNNEKEENESSNDSDIEEMSS